MKKLKQISTTALLVIFLASCQSPLRGALQLDANYDEIFFECVQAINEINFRSVGITRTKINIARHLSVFYGFFLGKLGCQIVKRTLARGSESRERLFVTDATRSIGRSGGAERLVRRLL